MEEEKKPVVDYDADSSSDLPDINDFFKETSTFEAEKLKKDDVVWADYRDLFWPALVRNLDKKNKKVSIWYLDSPGVLFKVPIKKIRGFNDDSVYTHNMKKLENSPLDEKHSRVYTRCLHFIDRRKRGIKDNVVEFFNLSRPVLLFDDIPESLECNNKNASTAEASEIKFCREKSSTTGSSEFKNNTENSTEKIEDVNVKLEVLSDGESSVKNYSDDEISVKIESEINPDGESSVKIESEINSGDESSIMNEVQDSANADSLRVSNSSSLYSNELADKIVSYIEAGHLNEYLLDIFNYQIKNEKHEVYMKAVEKDSTRALWFGDPPCVPIRNDKLLPLTIYLYKLFESEIGSRPFRNEYIIMVWLPEAVKKAESLINEESSQLPVDAGSEVSNSLSGAKESDLPVKSDSRDVSCQVESPESILVQLGSSESSSNSCLPPVITRLKRKLDSLSSFICNDADTSDMEACTRTISGLKKKLGSVSSVLNNDSNAPDMEACTSKKKKSTDIKEQKVKPVTYRSLRSTTAQKRAESREENLVASTPAPKASRNKTSVSKRNAK